MLWSYPPICEEVFSKSHKIFFATLTRAIVSRLNTVIYCRFAILFSGGVEVRSLGHANFVEALKYLDAEGVLDRSILISSASLRIMGLRVYTYFIDLLVERSYYLKKGVEEKFSPRYELEPLSLKIAGFPIRLGTIKDGLCSFGHLIEPYNVYVEVEFRLDEQRKLIKIRPHNYVVKDCSEAIERMIQRFDSTYWQDFYSYHKQIEAIDLGISKNNLRFGSDKILDFEV